jgi:bacteriocin biosynthesis cyclodehydratase domain-containing protein
MSSGKPRIKGGSHRIPDDILNSESAGNLLVAASQLLDGSNSWEQIWGKLLLAGFNPHSINSALLELQHDCEISYGMSPPSSPAIEQQILLFGQVSAQEGSITASGIPEMVGQKLQAALGSSEVAVFGESFEVTTEFHRRLEQVGVVKARTHCSANGSYGEAEQQPIEDFAHQLMGAKSSLMICATSGGNRQLSEIVNRVAIAHGIPAIYYHAQGLQVQLGPLVIPKQTACYECYKIRRDATLAAWERSLLRWAREGGQLASSLGTDWVIVDAIKHLTGFGEPVCRGRVLFVDYYAGLPEVHTVLRLPRCGVCGNPRRPSVRLWDES